MLTFSYSNRRKKVKGQEGRKREKEKEIFSPKAAWDGAVSLWFPQLCPHVWDLNECSGVLSVTVRFGDMCFSHYAATEHKCTRSSGAEPKPQWSMQTVDCSRAEQSRFSWWQRSTYTSFSGAEDGLKALSCHNAVGSPQHQEGSLWPLSAHQATWAQQQPPSLALLWGALEAECQQCLFFYIVKMTVMFEVIRVNPLKSCV